MLEDQLFEVELNMQLGFAPMNVHDWFEPCNDASVPPFARWSRPRRGRQARPPVRKRTDGARPKGPELAKPPKSGWPTHAC